jgi:hypothetical protein
MESVIQISKEVLVRLSTIGYEKHKNKSVGQLIFPSKSDLERISEQELRQVFIEIFSDQNQDLYYSIETPTINKYSFGLTHDTIKIADESVKGQSALIDMCVFKKDNDKSEYSRLLNIEFKHDNVAYKNFSKDILKLMHEEENGAFIILLNNTNSGTLINSGEKRKGVIDKLVQSFNDHKVNVNHWNGGYKKCIELIILSLEDKDNLKKKPLLWHRSVFKKDLDTTKANIEDWLKVE